jgi:hypothetical protein
MVLRSSNSMTITDVWVHLGASIGAALDWVPRLQTSDIEVERVALDCFTEDPEFVDLVSLIVVPTGTTKSGEAIKIHQFGGRFVSVIGNHALFHQESDQWPPLSMPRHLLCMPRR